MMQHSAERSVKGAIKGSEVLIPIKGLPLRSRGKGRSYARIVRVTAAAFLVASTSVITSCGSDLELVANPPVVTRVDVTAPTTTLSPAQAVQLTAVGRTSTGTVASTAFTWKTSAATVATVNGSGLVTAVAPGTATITASTSVGISGTVSLTVIAAGGTISTVTVTLSDAALQIGDLGQASLTARDASNAVVALGSRALTWSSTNPAIATVSDGGIISAVGIGNTQIRASVVDGANTVVGTANITVVPNPDAVQSADVTMPGNTFSPADIVLKVNGTARFIFPNVDHNVIWSPRVTGSPADILITANQTVTRAFPTAGVFPYVCTLHNGMKGTIVVSP